MPFATCTYRTTYALSHSSLYRASEEERSKVSVGTAALLDYLKSVHDDVIFSFCVGADAFLDLVDGKWRESERVLGHFDNGKRLIVLHRKGLDSSSNSSIVEAQVQKIGATLFTIPSLDGVSSSQVRACSNLDELRTMVDPSVLDYMKSNGLYQFAVD